jgi:Domain of unknown function (DUF1992)
MSVCPAPGNHLTWMSTFVGPEELRLAYSLLKSFGHVPEEVELLRELSELRQRLAKATDPVGRSDLQRRIQEQEVALNIKLERHRKR